MRALGDRPAVADSALARAVSLPSAIFIIIGYVIGATIFILPGSLATTTGPGVFIAYGLAAIPAVLTGLIMAQIGAALPVSGAPYVLLRRSLPPVFGFLYLWIMVSMAGVVIPLVAYGFADYARYFLPMLEARTAAFAITAVFIVLNALGMSVAAAAQNVMVVAFLAALLVFGIGGVSAGDAANLRPLFPMGLSPLTIAAITAYFSYAGFFVIAEVAGEIRQPRRNIPLALATSFAIVIFIYLLVPLALTMLMPWRDLADVDMAVVTASKLFLPTPVVVFVALGALFAAATSINGIMMGISRDFYQGAHTGQFPGFFAAVRERSHAPVRAVVLVGALALAGVIVGGTVTDYAQVALMGLMIIQIMTGTALLRLPSVMDDADPSTGFQMSRRMLTFVSVSYILTSIAFLFLLAGEQPRAGLVGLAYLSVGFVGHGLWSRQVRRAEGGQ
jgi:APA family basic amino acid/polyamine antiporter